MNKLKLISLDCLLVIFFLITFPLGWIVMVLEIVFNFLTLFSFNTMWTNVYTNFCVTVIRKITIKQLKLSFNGKRAKKG